MDTFYSVLGVLKDFLSTHYKHKIVKLVQPELSLPHWLTQAHPTCSLQHISRALLADRSLQFFFSPLTIFAPLNTSSLVIWNVGV